MINPIKVRFSSPHRILCLFGLIFFNEIKTAAVLVEPPKPALSASVTRLNVPQSTPQYLPMGQGTKAVSIVDDEIEAPVEGGEEEGFDDEEEALNVQEIQPTVSSTSSRAAKVLASRLPTDKRESTARPKVVEVAFGDKTLVLDKKYLENYVDNFGLLVTRNKDFADGFEQSVLADQKGRMYSSDLQWFYDGKVWQPVEYQFIEKLDLTAAGTVVKVGKIQVQLSGLFYDIPKKFLTDSTWHNKMQESKQFAAKDNGSPYDSIRAKNFNAYLGFLQAAAPKELDVSQAQKLDELESKALAQSRWQGAGKKVSALSKIKKAGQKKESSQPAAAPMTINVTVGSSTAPSAPPAAVVTPVFSGPPSFMSAVTPQGQVAPQSGSGSVTILNTQGGQLPSGQFPGGVPGQMQGSMAPGIAFLIVPFAPMVLNKIKLSFGIASASDSSGVGSFNQGSSFLTPLIAACVGILSEIQKLGQTSNQSQFGKLSFFQLVDTELTSAIALCDRILSLTGTLKDKSNLMFYALRLWDDNEFKKYGKDQMQKLIKQLTELLGIALDKQDEAADTNEISIFTLFHRFGTSSAIQPLFDRIKGIFENLLANHGLIAWMLAFGKLGELSRFLRRGAHVAAMPQLKIVQQGQSWTMLDTPESDTANRDGSPGYHTPGKSSYIPNAIQNAGSRSSSSELSTERSSARESGVSKFIGYNPIALYNSIAKGLQDCFGKLYNYGKAVNAQSSLIEIVEDLFKILSTKSFVLFMAEPGFEEWKAIDGSKTAKDQQFQTLEGNSTDPSLLQAYFKNLTDPNFVGKLTASMLRELVAKKIIYLLGLINTEVFQSLGFSLKKMFSSIKTRQQMAKMDETTRIYIGCLNQAILKGFVLQLDGGTKNMILPKDKFSQQVFNNWMETDTKNGKKIGLVFGSTILDAQLIERLIDWYKTFNTTVRSPVGLLRNIFTKGPDQRVSTLDSCLKSIVSTLSEALYRQKYSKMFYSEVPGYWYYLISADVSLRILKLALMFFDKIKWLGELVAPSDYDEPILRKSFQSLANTMDSSGFLDGIASINTDQGGKIKTSFQTIARAPNKTNSTDPAIRNDQFLLDILKEIKGLSETC